MNHDNAVALAKRLIAGHGRSVIMQQLGASATDPSRPWNGQSIPVVSVIEKVTAAFVPHTGSDLGKFFVSEELLKRCNEVGLVAGGTKNELSVFHQVVDGNRTFKLEWVQVLKPGTVNIVYAFGIMR